MFTHEVEKPRQCSACTGGFATCRTCNGSGWKPNGRSTCLICHGLGSNSTPYLLCIRVGDRMPCHRRRQVECDYCNGRGNLEGIDVVCEDCGGRAYVSSGSASITSRQWLEFRSTRNGGWHRGSGSVNCTASGCAKGWIVGDQFQERTRRENAWWVRGPSFIQSASPYGLMLGDWNTFLW